MRTILLGVTPQLHEEAAAAVRGGLNRATFLIGCLVFVPAILWGLHAIGVIPSFFKRVLPPEAVSAIGSIEGSIDGATGFLLDPKHFLTTERALKGDGGAVAKDEAAKVAFPDAEGKPSEAVEGSVVWISEPTAGTRLVLVGLKEDRLDFLPADAEPLKDGSRHLVAGHLLNPEDGKPALAQGSMGLTLFEDGLGSADWGEADPPPYEGAPVVRKMDDGSYAVTGLLSQGSLVVKLPVEEIREAGVDL
jgi:hypothetical protein